MDTKDFLSRNRIVTNIRVINKKQWGGIFFEGEFMSYLSLFSRDFSLAFVMLSISYLVCCYENWSDLL